MATAKMLGFIIGLIITIIVFGAIFGCVNKFLNPKCDSRAVDAFNAFNILYDKCMDVNINKICKCGEFNIRDLPLEHKIIVSPAIKDEKEVVRSTLVCNGLTADKEHFESQGNERIRVYFYDPINFEERSDMDQLVRTVRDETDSKKLNWIYTEQGDKVRSGPIYISEEILQDGFEIENTEITHYVKNVGLLLGVNEPLNLVYLNGKVAFMAQTKSQKDKVSFSNCF